MLMFRRVDVLGGGGLGLRHVIISSRSVSFSFELSLSLPLLFITNRALSLVYEIRIHDMGCKKGSRGYEFV